MNKTSRRFLGIFAFVLLIAMMTSYFFPGISFVPFGILAILVTIATWKFWPAFVQITPPEKRNPVGMGEDTQKRQMGEIARMSFAIQNASGGSTFSKTELGSILRNNLLYRTGGGFPKTKPFEGKSHSTYKIQSKAIERIQPELREVFFPDRYPQLKRSYNPVSILKGSSSNYERDLENALEFLDTIGR